MTDQPWRLLVLPPAPDGLVEQLVAGLPVQLSRPGERTPEAVRAGLAGAELVLGDWSGVLGLDAAAFESADRLAFVQMPTVGVDSVDLEAAAARGVPVANAAGANAVSVAEWCLGAALALIRRLVAADAAVRAGEWPQTGLAIRELAGMRAGVIGMGPIGEAVASRLGAFGADVAYWSRSRRPDGTVPARWCELDELLARSELLVVVIALARATRGLLSADRLALLPPGAYLVNASRGGVVDEPALAAALAGGRLGGLAADVFEQEPLPAASPLLGLPNVLLSPHVAGASVTAQLRLLAAARDNLERACRGEPVRDVRNGVSPQVYRRGAGGRPGGPAVLR